MINDKSPYAYAIKKAGAEVHIFGEFGDYQGTWCAKVTYQNITGWVIGSYGSCSGCDTFEAEFEYSSHYHENDDNECLVSWYDLDDFDVNCEKCLELEERLIRFGMHYIIAMMTQEEAERSLGQHVAYSLEDQEALLFIKNYAVEKTAL